MKTAIIGSPRKYPAIWNCIFFTGAYLYFYRPGVAVDPRGGGVIIPLPPSVGQYVAY